MKEDNEQTESVLWCTINRQYPAHGPQGNALGIPAGSPHRPWRPRCGSVCAWPKEPKCLITQIFVKFE